MGKTRACFEALRTQLPEYRVATPAGGPDLMLAVEVIDRTGTRCAVWLDDLENYLGPEGLEPGLLTELVRLRIPVLATMRHQQFEIFAAPEDPSEAGSEHARLAIAGARVLRQLEAVELDRVWTAGELERAGEVDDDRIADALDRHGPYGLTEYLAAGPALLQEWHRATRPGGHPRAAALIAAAVDLARTGLRPPYPIDLLTDTHEPYLVAAGGPLLRPESLDTALEWATRRRHGVTSLLVPTQDPNAWNVFDYLTDHTRTPIPDTTWHAALQHATEPDDLATLGFHAHHVAPVIAEDFYRQAADVGHTGAMINLAALLARAGHTDEAEQFLRRAAGTGHTDAMNNLGLLLDSVGRTDEAEWFLRLAGGIGNVEAMNNLGVRLARTGRVDEAEVFFRRAADAGHTGAMNCLGVLLHEVGGLAEAEVFLRRAADAGHTGAMYSLGVLLYEVGGLAEAEVFLRRAADAGHTGAMYSLGVLLYEVGGPAEAEVFLRRAADAGPTGAMNLLGVLLYEAGRVAEAEVFLCRAADAGDPDAANSLGILLSRTGRMGEAETAYRRAADAGHSGANNNLGILLGEAGGMDEAEDFFRRAADAGHTDAMRNLAILLRQTGRAYEAEIFVHRANDGEAGA
ncbi:sel1 repeat family protein [Streptomyces anulatus]|uniref:tetratricopeptide repeat protein n=1 Tax=Streptomyces anulatus TaxID=1892 RepID=UPI00386B08FE|nr:sel1 repeat family protein [Streptomyces anulatus]